MIMHISKNGLNILHKILRGTFQIPNKISYPHIERYDFTLSCNFENSQIWKFNNIFKQPPSYEFWLELIMSM